MATEQDLLDWTKEYSSLRNHHGNDDLLDFNEWMKVKIASKVQSSPPNSPIPTTPHHINRPTHSSPFISSPTPSASPSPSPPPSLSPNRFPHQPIPRHSPILSPSLSPTPPSKHTNTLPNRRPPLYFSPPLNSHSLVLRKSNHPHNPQYGNNTLSVPNDTETLKNLFLHFQNKQQQQINQVFEIVEQLNTKINNNHTTKSTKKPKKQNNNKKPKKALSPEYAIFNEQIMSVRKLLQDEYARAMDSTNYTKKIYQMTKLRKIHQAAVEFLIALAQRMQHSQIERSEFSDPSIDLGMIISQLAGLGAEMQMNFPFLVPENGSGPPNKDPFALKLTNLPKQPKKQKRKQDTSVQTLPVQREAGSQTKQDIQSGVTTDRLHKLAEEVGELKSVTQNSTQVMLQQNEFFHKESKILEKEATREMQDLKTTFTSFLERFENLEREKFEREREIQGQREKREKEDKERRERMESERREREERYKREREEREWKERREREEREWRERKEKEEKEWQEKIEREERERIEQEEREKRDREDRERREKIEREERERRRREEKLRKEREERDRIEKEERERLEYERLITEEREWRKLEEQERQSRAERERQIRENRERRQEMERRERERERKERERERQERERRERERESERESAKHMDLLMSTLSSMEEDEQNLRNSVHSLLGKLPTKPQRPPPTAPSPIRKSVPFPSKKGRLTDSVVEDVCMMNATEMDGICGDYLDELARLQVNEVMKEHAGIDIKDLY